MKSIDQQVELLTKRFDKHLEIYANNGKESQRVADNLEALIQQNNEMYTLFSTFKGGWTVSKWVFGLFVAVGSAWVLIQKIKGG